MRIIRNRRAFLARLSAIGAAALVNRGKALAAEPPPETTVVRLTKVALTDCQAAS
jgi:NitT/TauT family transport system substrate-binding protein